MQSRRSLPAGEVEDAVYRALGSVGGSCTCMGASVGDPALLDGTECTTQLERDGLRQDEGVCVEGAVVPYQKISDQMRFSGGLQDGDGFGSSMTALGNLGSPGIGELAAGASTDDRIPLRAI